MTKDEHLPDGQWAFDEAVANVFDDMLQRSIPQYAEMRSVVTSLAMMHLRAGGAVVDLGCSRGGALAPIVEQSRDSFWRRAFVGCEVSQPMLDAARARFADDPCVSIRHVDLRTDYPIELACVTLCVLTLQFVPIDHRLRLVREMRRHTIPGGCVLLVEKVLGATDVVDERLSAHYRDMKRAHGYSDEQIERKRLSLEGVLVPITARWTEDMLQRAGFDHVDCVWRWGKFAAWIACVDWQEDSRGR